MTSEELEIFSGIVSVSISSQATLERTAKPVMISIFMRGKVELIAKRPKLAKMLNGLYCCLWRITRK
jgi:hypothetical protein